MTEWIDVPQEPVWQDVDAGVGWQDVDAKEPSVLADVATQIPTAVVRAGTEFVESANALAQSFESLFPKDWLAWRDDAQKALGVDMGREDIGKALDKFTESLPKAETTAGAIAGTFTQFAVPFGVAAKGLKAVGMGNNLLRAYTAGAVADFTAFDAHEERLSNFLTKVDNPILNNEVTQYLASDKDDSEAEGRIKQVLEGLALGGMIDTVGRGLRVVKAAHVAKRNLHKVQKATPKIQEAVGRYQELGYNQAVATEKAMKALKLDKVDFTKINELKPIDLSDEAIKKIPRTKDVADAVAKAEGKYVHPNSFVRFMQNTSKGFAKHTSDALLGVLERIAEISPRAAHRLNQFELDVHIRTYGAREQVKDFTKNYLKLNKAEKAEFKGLWLNQNREGIEDFMATRPELAKGYDQVQQLLKQWGEEGKRVGAIEQTASGYLPRLVTDHDALLKQMDLEKGHPLSKMLTEARNKVVNRELTRDEVSEVINKYMRTNIPETLKAGKTQHSRARVFEVVSEDMSKFYADPLESLGHYIGTMGDNIEKRRFLGYNNPDQSFSDMMAVRDSIGTAFADDLAAGNINLQDLNQITDLLHARMGQGEKSTHRLLQNAKNFMYMGLLSNPVSAVTQLGDVALAVHVNGVGNTIHALAQRIAGRALNKEVLGISQHAEDMLNPLKSHRWLDKAMWASGFQKIDDIGKSIVITGSKLKIQKLAKTSQGRNALRSQYAEAFTPQELDMFLDEAAKGIVSPRTKYAMWNDLTKMQPVSLSELPKWYLNNPNGRVFYALKTFTIKQLNRLYFDGINEIRKGNYKKGVGNLIKFAGLLTAGGMTTDAIKDVMQGRDPMDFDDNFVNNLYKVAGTSDYVVSMLEKGDLRGAAYATIAPPIFPAAEAAFKDAVTTDDISQWKSFQYVPVVGRLYHQWFGGGMEAYNERKAREEGEDDTF